MLRAVILISCLALPLAALAEQGSPGYVAVSVRVLKATNIMSEPPGRALSFVANDRHIALDQRITDLRSKLKRLSYTSYRLLSSMQRDVAMTRRTVIPLGAGDLLTVRPLYIEGEKVAMWLRWEDRSGQIFLDTRMHLIPGESFVTGTDQTQDSGLILAIDVKPSAADAGSAASKLAE